MPSWTIVENIDVSRSLQSQLNAINTCERRNIETDVVLSSSSKSRMLKLVLKDKDTGKQCLAMEYSPVESITDFLKNKHSEALNGCVLHEVMNVRSEHNIMLLTDSNVRLEVHNVHNEDLATTFKKKIERLMPRIIRR